jgi:uncharacterized protein YkwD
MHHPRHPGAPAGRSIWLLLATLLALQTTAPSASARSDLSVVVVHLVNQTRDDRGLDRLDVRGHLNDVALEQARRMAQRGVLFHNPDLVDDMVGNWQWVGENVGYGPDVRTVQAAFMTSPAHRANILDGDFTRLGTAAVRRGTRVWVVQVFLAK